MSSSQEVKGERLPLVQGLLGFHSELHVNLQESKLTAVRGRWPGKIEEAEEMAHPGTEALGKAEAIGLLQVARQTGYLFSKTLS